MISLWFVPAYIASLSSASFSNFDFVLVLPFLLTFVNFAFLFFVVRLLLKELK